MALQVRNTGLFSVIGTIYGGDGRSTFSLPNLQGSAPLGAGQGINLSERSLGETGGSTTVELAESSMAAHAHGFVASEPAGTTTTLTDQLIANSVDISMDGPPSDLGAPGSESVGSAGGIEPHNNLQPYLTLNLCIAMTGTYPF